MQQAPCSFERHDIVHGVQGVNGLHRTVAVGALADDLACLSVHGAGRAEYSHVCGALSAPLARATSGEYDPALESWLSPPRGLPWPSPAEDTARDIADVLREEMA